MMYNNYAGPDLDSISSYNHLNFTVPEPYVESHS